MPSKYIEGIYPIYLEGGRGCYVTDGEGNQFIDYPLGLGAILLGHAYPQVNSIVKSRIDQGTIFTLPSFWETVLAKKLKQLIPCAEKTRFLKTGSEATSAAIKITRAYTKREKIIVCGYHGWHDWFTISTPKNDGIPKSYQPLTLKGEFNNIESIKKHFEYDINDIAAVILEPCVFEEPKDNFLQEVIRIAHENGALVIFDEVVTGFRFAGFSAQKFFGVIPDLATFGKALGNGFPISFVCGKREIMDVLEGDCFVSSTFGGDLVGISAALATINVLETNDVMGHIDYLGSYLKDGYNEIAQSLQIDTKCIGYPNRTLHVFPSAEHKSLFWQECIIRGILFGYATFICYSHTQEDIDYTLNVIKDVLQIVKENWKNPKKTLQGKVASEVFRFLATQGKGT